jgi:hypothetical protein
MNTQLRKHTLNMHTTPEKNYVNNTLEGPTPGVDHGSPEETQPEQGGICQAAWGVMDSCSSVGDSGCGTITGELPQAAPVSNDPFIIKVARATRKYAHARNTRTLEIHKGWNMFTRELVELGLTNGWKKSDPEALRGQPGILYVNRINEPHIRGRTTVVTLAPVIYRGEEFTDGTLLDLLKAIHKYVADPATTQWRGTPEDIWNALGTGYTPSKFWGVPAMTRALNSLRFVPKSGVFGVTRFEGKGLDYIIKEVGSPAPTSPSNTQPLEN